MTISDQYPFFAYLSRMRYISHWGLIHNTFQENIQEHSHMVAMLTHTLVVIRRDVLDGDANPDLTAAAALHHDAPETLTGDLPTLIKYYNSDIRDACREVEQFSTHKLLHMLPETLRPSFVPLLREGYNSGLRTLVKVVGKLSAHIKCVRGLKTGNAEFKQTTEQALEALQGYSPPELDYFLEHFLPTFRLTLGELQ